jgi:hypothetical protein
MGNCWKKREWGNQGFYQFCPSKLISLHRSVSVLLNLKLRRSAAPRLTNPYQGAIMVEPLLNEEGKQGEVGEYCGQGN